MVHQSDLPFRILVRRYGASLAYTQMLIPERLLNDQDYFEFHRKGLGEHSIDRPVVVQLCGDDPEIIVRAGKKLQSYCDGIDLNLGCPQKAAEEGHYGAYLLDQADWSLVQTIVSTMVHSLTVPVSAKIRLCQPASKTQEFGQCLKAAGVSWITLHARHVSARRRRHGAAKLEEVMKLKENVKIPVVSNGNVRILQDVLDNQVKTGADGIMVGEALLGNPCLFAGIIPDPIDISLEYLEICDEHPQTAAIDTIRSHVRHFLELQCSTRTWFTKFRNQLGICNTIEGVRHLLTDKVQRWQYEGVIGKDKPNAHTLLDDEGDIISLGAWNLFL